MDISTHSLTRRLTRSVFLLPEATRFQLTASQGGWPTNFYAFTPSEFISTHSLTRRLTMKWRYVWSLSIYFNSQPHKEADPLSARSSSATVYFNSQPHKEADRATGHYTEHWAYFNSQPHKEADGISHSLQFPQLIFQLTASQGGWPCSESY